MRSDSAFLFFVKALTRGTIIIETAIAVTPISGDFAAAAENPDCREITNVAPPTVIRPERTPANAPVFVIFFENNPQM